MAIFGNSILREPEEFLVVKVRITHNAKVSFGFVNAVEKEFAGKKVQKTYQAYAMIAGLM